ncbi:MAG: hypothetical protein V4857_16590 [Pseudomonadota bacterium]
MYFKKFKQRLGQQLGFNPLAWIRSGLRVEAMLDQWLGGAAAPRPAADARTIAVLVTPWLATVVPWYSIVVGVLLAARGARVVYVFDDLPFSNAPKRALLIRATIRRVLRRFAGPGEVLVLSRFLGAPGAPVDGAALIERMAALNAVHALRGEMVADGRAGYVALVRRQLQRADPAIQALLAGHRFDVLFIPGGIYGTTGLWLDRAKRAGVRVASYDAGGYGTVLFAADGIAAQLQDVPRAFARLKDTVASEREHALILRVARGELDKRHQGKDAFGSQMVATSAGPLEKYRGAILLALNSSWDQAALGLHAVFETNTEWIVETARWVVEHTDATIVIRQHPSERLAVASTSDDYAALLRHHFGGHERVLFVHAADPVNTYELLTVVSTVVAYTSTIGVEAAALGNRVIVPSRSYYAGLGFVWSAAARAAYFSLIRQSVAGELVLTTQMRQDAMYCYYVTQICNWIFSPFSPESFELWSRESIAGLNADPTVGVLLEALAHDIPAALFNHRGRLAAEPVEGGGAAAADAADEPAEPAEPAAAAVGAP